MRRCSGPAAIALTIGKRRRDLASDDLADKPGVIQAIRRIGPGAALPLIYGAPDIANNRL